MSLRVVEFRCKHILCQIAERQVYSISGQAKGDILATRSLDSYLTLSLSWSTTAFTYLGGKSVQRMTIRQCRMPWSHSLMSSVALKLIVSYVIFTLLFNTCWPLAFYIIDMGINWATLIYGKKIIPWRWIPNVSRGLVITREFLKIFKYCLRSTRSR